MMEFAAKMVQRDLDTMSKSGKWIRKTGQDFWMTYNDWSSFLQGTELEHDIYADIYQLNKYKDKI